jgi:hypothetical protein
VGIVVVIVCGLVDGGIGKVDLKELKVRVAWGSGGNSAILEERWEMAVIIRDEGC